MKTQPLQFAHVEDGAEASRAFFERMTRRRTVREFSPDAVPTTIVEHAIRTAGTAPSGANQQPWHFVAVSKSDVALRRRIRVEAEEEERDFYTNRAPKEWLEALAPLGTDADKPFLEIAPWLIAVFVRPHGVRPDGSIMKHYYAVESVGIATGMLIASLHLAGVATLTHTPSPMGFLNQLLGRPSRERPFLLLVAGYPVEGARVPDITRKPLEDIATFL